MRKRKSRNGQIFAAQRGVMFQALKNLEAQPQIAARSRSASAVVVLPKYNQNYPRYHWLSSHIQLLLKNE